MSKRTFNSEVDARPTREKGANCMKLIHTLPLLFVLMANGDNLTAASPSELAPFVAEKVSPTVHLLTTPEDYYGPVIGNVVLIEQADGFIVIDSGLTAGNGRSVVAYAQSLSGKPIKAVAITHWHNDHPQGISSIRAEYPDVRIIATEETEKGMLGPESFDVGYAPDPRFDDAMSTAIGRHEEMLGKIIADPTTEPERRARARKALADYRSFPASFRGTYIVPPTETFRKRLRLDDQREPVQLLHLGRANTTGDLIAWLPRSKVVVTGDIVVAPTPFGFSSFPSDWLKTIAKLKALGFRTLIPGHGEPQNDAAYLVKLEQAITVIRNQVSLFAKDGRTLDEVREAVDFSEVVAKFGNTPRNRSLFESYFVEPMISNAFKEARGEPIVQGEGTERLPFAHTPPKPSSRRHQS